MFLGKICGCRAEKKKTRRLFHQMYKTYPTRHENTFTEAFRLGKQPCIEGIWSYSLSREIWSWSLSRICCQGNVRADSHCWDLPTKPVLWKLSFRGTWGIPQILDFSPLQLSRVLLAFLQIKRMQTGPRLFGVESIAKLQEKCCSITDTLFAFFLSLKNHVLLTLPTWSCAKLQPLTCCWGVSVSNWNLFWIIWVLTSTHCIPCLSLMKSTPS